MGIFSFFKKTTKEKPVAAVFVDYEHWYISLKTQYRIKPDLKGWMKDLSDRFKVKDLLFFGDFSHDELSKEIPRIREVSSRIIETKNTNTHHKKDFTDFIMLDSIYQRAMHAEDIDVFILFTGDGHFSSVVSFLVNFCHKQVGVYGIQNAFSTQLKNTASWTRELPKDEDLFDPYNVMILDSLYRLAQKKNQTGHPTFRKTVDSVSAHCREDREKIRTALQWLMDHGYVKRLKTKSMIRRDAIALQVDWEACKKDKIWAPKEKRESV